MSPKPWTIDRALSPLRYLAYSPTYLALYYLHRTLSPSSRPWPPSPIDALLLLLAAALALLPALHATAQRYAFGPPRTLAFAADAVTGPKARREVVVITGGSGGLGRVLAATYAARGAGVAVLDVREYAGDGVLFCRADVGDEMSVDAAKARIEAELGPPTVLINNAGVVNGRPLLDLTPAMLRRGFDVNLLAHFHTIRAFVPGMIARPGGGTVVTVASVLGDLGAARLSDYTAAKAGLMAMHASLRAELDGAGHVHVKTVLVKPGQLSTPLFRGVETPSSFLGPVVEPEALAEEIVRVIDAGQTAVVAMPLYANWIELVSVLPYTAQRLVRWVSGVDRAMSSFKVE